MYSSTAPTSDSWTATDITTAQSHIKNETSMYNHRIYSRTAATQKYYNPYFHFMELCPAEQHVGRHWSHLTTLYIWRKRYTECTHVNVTAHSLTTLTPI